MRKSPGKKYGYIIIPVVVPSDVDAAKAVDDNERYKGIGTRLLGRAEEIAVNRGCKHAHLATHDFQNLEFYEGRGYQVFGELADLPEGHTKYYLHKGLAGRPPEQPSASSR